MPFVADDLGAWLVGLLADAGRKKLTALVLGSEQERALRQAATAAAQAAAGELSPDDAEQAAQLARVVDKVFTAPVPGVPLTGDVTMLEELSAGIAGQLAVLDDASLTGTGQSSADVLEVPGAVLAEKLTAFLLREIVVRGSGGGALFPLASQLNDDLTHLQVRRLEGVVDRRADELLDALARLDTCQPPEVRYSLPPDAAAFTGREEELDRITAAVAQGATAGGVVAICPIGGMPGVGKTALAVHAAHLLRHRFPDRQLFIDLHAHTPGHKPVTPQAALAGLLTATGVDARSLPRDLDDRAALWRDRMAGQRVLLVLDNAESSAQAAPLLPGSDSCLVLVTSRRHLGDLPGAADPLLVKILTPGEAREMFVRLAPRAADAPAAAVGELTELAEGLPLAISLLARVYARHPSWTIADLTAETRASMLTLTAEADSVAAAFDVSYRYLSPGQRQFFRRLGLNPGTTIDAYAAAALAGTGLRDAAGQLDALHGEGLLTETGYRRYGMHDLIRRYARDRAANSPAKSRDQALGRLLDYYQHTAALAETFLARRTCTSPAPAAPSDAVPDLTDSTQALAWARAERSNLLACLDHATATGQHARVAALTAGMSALLRIDGPWNDAVTRHTTAAQAARQLGDWLGQANALNYLGYVRLQTGDYAGAVQALQEALGIYRDLGDRLGQACALTDLGNVRRVTDDYAGAARAMEEALGIARDLGDRLGQANALLYLGIVRRVTDDCAGAARAMEEALGIYRDLGDRLGQACALTYLGDVRRATDDYTGATQVLEEALGIARDLRDRLGQANALLYLGVVRRVTDDYAGAARAMEEALGIYRDLGDRSAEATGLNEAGTLHRIRGDLSAAGTCHRQSLDLAREIGSSWDEAHALAGLARCALAAGRTADAEAGLRQAQETFQRIGAAEASDVSAELDALITNSPAAQGS
jgi:tetratricopeptide (TPR) repeat protein